jgi:hypothetical protein
MFPIKIGVKGQAHWTLEWSGKTFWALEHYPFHLESPYHTFRLPMGGRCSLSKLGSKVKRTGHWSGVEKLFLGPRTLSFLPRVTIPHI